MPFNLKLSNIPSAVLNSNIVKNEGIKTIAGVSSNTAIERKKKGGILSTIGNGVVSFGFQVFSIIGSGFQLSFSALWGSLVSAKQFLFNFDWNATDQQIDQQVKSQWESFGGRLGGSLGNTLGWLTCGVIPATSTFVLNEGLALYLLANVGEEFLDELAFNVSSLILATGEALAVTAFAKGYKNIRTLLKAPNSIARQILGDKTIDAWGSKNSKAWSFNQAIEDRIDKIKNPFVRNFTDQFLEEFEEGCIEAGYILSFSLDNYFATPKEDRANLLGNDRVIEITPNRDVPEETLVLAGKEEVLKGQLLTAMSTHSLIENRDVGYVIGNYDEFGKTVFPSEISIQLQYSDRQRPPFSTRSTTRKVQVTIAEVKRSQLDYQKIRNIADKNGYQWGRYKATAKMTNRRSISVYGGTAAIAENRVRKLSALTDADIMTINVTEELKKDNRLKNAKLQKDSTQVYPNFCSVMVSLNRSTGQASLDGRNRRKEVYRFPIWSDQAPPDFKEQLQQLFLNDSIPGLAEQI